MDPLDTFTANLRAARASAGLTQEAVANAIGMVQSHYSRIETGQHDPSVRTVAKVAAGLNTTVAALMRGV